MEVIKPMDFSSFAAFCEHLNRSSTKASLPPPPTSITPSPPPPIPPAQQQQPSLLSQSLAESPKAVIDADLNTESTITTNHAATLLLDNITTATTTTTNLQQILRTPPPPALTPPTITTNNLIANAITNGLNTHREKLTHIARTKIPLEIETTIQKTAANVENIIAMHKENHISQHNGCSIDFKVKKTNNLIQRKT